MARTISRPRGFRHRRGHLEGAGAPHPSRTMPTTSSGRRGCIRQGANGRCCWSAAASTCRRRWAALTRFAEAQSIPVAHTMSGKGRDRLFEPAQRRSCSGAIRGSPTNLIDKADCLIVVGCKLGEIATKRYALPPRHIPIIHLEIVAEEIGRCHPAEVALWGDARAGLEDLTAALSDSGKAKAAARARLGRRDRGADEDMGGRRRAAAPNSRDRPVHMARLCQGTQQDAAERTRSSSPMADLPGIGRGSSTTPRWPDGAEFIPDRGLASIGYGLPGGIGAALAAPKTPVVAITGDGGFNMMLGELGDRAAARMPEAHRDRHQQRRLGLREEALAARDDGRPVPVGRPRSSMDYAAIAQRRWAARRHRGRGPRRRCPACPLRQGMAERDRPTVIDVVVTPRSGADASRPSTTAPSRSRRATGWRSSYPESSSLATGVRQDQSHTSLAPGSPLLRGSRRRLLRGVAGENEDR